MLLALAIAFFVGITWAAVGAVSSHSASTDVDFIGIMALMTSAATFFAWIIFPRYGVLMSRPIQADIAPIGVVFLSGVAQAFGLVMLNLGMRLGHHGATWTIGQSALTVPFILGIAIWGDQIRAANAVGLLFLLCAIGLFGASKNSSESIHGGGKWLTIALLSLLLLGAQQTLTTIPSRWAGWQDEARLRVPMMLTGKLIVYWGLLAMLRRKINRRAWRPAAVLCAITLVSSPLTFLAIDLFAKFNRAALVYPITVGVCTTAFSFYSVFVLKERATFQNILGMAMGCIGIGLVAI